MLEFILKYWIQWLFGLIATGLGITCRKLYKLYTNEKKQQESAKEDELYNKVKKVIEQNAKEFQLEDEKLQDQINTIKNGILSLQGRSFRQDCRELLKEEHEIALQEFENIQKEHSIYKSLGGNHDGDDLFALVKEKATRDITQ